MKTSIVTPVDADTGGRIMTDEISEVAAAIGISTEKASRVKYKHYRTTGIDGRLYRIVEATGQEMDAYREYSLEEIEKPKPVVSLREMDKLAKAAGMSYGYFVALTEQRKAKT